MTPEYVEELADMCDPDQLWRLPALEQLDLPEGRRRQLDAGIALRRHASHVRELRALLGREKALLITPTSVSSTIVAIVTPPRSHLRKLRGQDL